MLFCYNQVVCLWTQFEIVALWDESLRGFVAHDEAHSRVSAPHTRPCTSQKRHVLELFFREGSSVNLVAQISRHVDLLVIFVVIEILIDKECFSGLLFMISLHSFLERLSGLVLLKMIDSPVLSKIEKLFFLQFMAIFGILLLF